MMIIYGKEMCEYCDKAKEICRQYEIEFEYHSVDDRFSGEARLAELKERLLSEGKSIKTVPVIWDRNHWIGGYNELMTYIEQTGRHGGQHG